MRTTTTAQLLPDLALVPESELAIAVIDGLSRPKKSLPCRFFYDARGSELFEEITRLPEYYPTRIETGILEDNGHEIVEGIGDRGVLVEFGSGSSRKTEILLRQLPPRVAYVPVDVSESALSEASARLANRFPGLDIRPIVADFSHAVRLPAGLARRLKTGFFPGSTIGNLPPTEAASLLRAFKAMLAPRGRLVIGVDLKKDARRLVLAYNDAAGVTAAFNLNLLHRINREVEHSFDLSSFRHEAIYDPREGRIEMHLVSRADQSVTICGRRFRFSAGETIHTENSYKYTVGEFQDLARSAGWTPSRVWSDAECLFSVHELCSE
jgi:dimethylhistidine N-methyltransferase